MSTHTSPLLPLSLSLSLSLGLSLTACDDDAQAPQETPNTTDQGLGDQGAQRPDAGPELVDIGVAPDMSPPAPPQAPPCGVEPACERGARCVCPTDDELTCVCQSPLSRACERDEECRPGERCEAREGARLCWLEPSSLSARRCPGELCPQASPDDDGVLYVGARSMPITPLGFESPTPLGLEGAQMSFTPPLEPMSELWRDCGYDDLCPGEPGYVAPDEGEGDGWTQGAFIAGFSHGRPAQKCPAELIGCDRPECCVSALAHDELLAQVVVLRRGGRTLGLVSLDVVGLFHSEVERIRRAAREELELDHLIIGATHTHEGFDTVGQYGPGATLPVTSGVDPHMMTRVRSQVLEGLRGALSDLHPARAQAVILDEGVEGLGVCDSRPPYIFDDNIPLLHFRDAETGEGLATLLSVANHPESLWADNPYLSSDYMHFVRAHLREGLPEVRDAEGALLKPALEGVEGVTLTFAGALGGLLNPGAQVPARRYDGVEVREVGFDKADAIGQRIAEIALSARARGEWAELTGPEGGAPELSFSTKPLLIPVTNPVFLLGGYVLKLFNRDMYNAVPLGGTSFAPSEPRVMSEVSVARLGDVTLITAPGEVFPELLTGGYPNRSSAQDPTLGDVTGVKAPFSCDEQGLPAEGGSLPCRVRPNQENPPPWSEAPEGPYLYELAGERPFFIGLGGDFLGYLVPEYDYQPNNAPGSHYEETNGASGEMTTLWREALIELLSAE